MPTASFLRRKGIRLKSLLDTCIMYDKEETIDHLYMHCEVASHLWSLFIHKSGLECSLDQSWGWQNLDEVGLSLCVVLSSGGSPHLLFFSQYGKNKTIEFLEVSPLQQPIFGEQLFLEL